MKITKNDVFSFTNDAFLELKKQSRKQYLPVGPESRWGRRAVSKIVNAANKALVALAYLITGTALGAFDLLTFPVRLVLKKRKMQHYFAQEELKLLPESEKYRLWDRINAYIKQRHLQISDDKLDAARKQALISYARSKQYYKPVATLWVDHLLRKASKEGKKLVFLARDGAAPRKLAMKLLKEYPSNYPNISESDMPLAYFSRKVIQDCQQRGAEGKQDMKDYMKQLGVEPNDECILVDVGFQGSMIEPIKELLEDYQISFEYLISHTPKAEGFFGTHMKDLMSVKVGGAGGNAAIHWLEDSHQGAIFSAKKLERVDGSVYPSTRKPGQKVTYRDNPGLKSSEERSLSHIQYLLRKISKEAITSLDEYTAKIGDIVKEDAFINLDSFLLKIKKGELPLFVSHD